MAEIGKLVTLVYLVVKPQYSVTVSGKSGLIAHLKVSRNATLNIQSVVACQ